MSVVGYAETGRKMKIERQLWAWKRTFASLQTARQNAATSSRSLTMSFAADKGAS